MLQACAPTKGWPASGASLLGTSGLHGGSVVALQSPLALTPALRLLKRCGRLCLAWARGLTGLSSLLEPEVLRLVLYPRPWWPWVSKSSSNQAPARYSSSGISADGRVGASPGP